MRRILALVLACALTAGLLAGCGAAQKGSTAKTIHRKEVSSAEVQFTAPAADDPVAVILTSAGEIRAVLYPSLAPQACDNFTRLAGSGYYNGTTVSKVAFGSYVEAGYAADGTASTVWNGSGFAPETTDKLHHYSGALCAPVSDTGECKSVFYVVETPQQAPDDTLLQQMTDAGWRDDVISAYKAAGGLPYLDNTDTVFGQVYSGMAVVDTIAQAEADENGTPAQAITILSVTITTYAQADSAASAAASAAGSAGSASPAA